jgi:hypothetical protein
MQLLPSDTINSPKRLLEDILNEICARFYKSEMTEFAQFYDAIFHDEQSLHLSYACDTNFFKRYFDDKQNIQKFFAIHFQEDDDFPF